MTETGIALLMKPEVQIDPRERAIVVRLREERIKQGISATELAKRIGVHRSTINYLESNAIRPGLWVILKLCDGLGLDLWKDLTL